MADTPQNREQPADAKRRSDGTFGPGNRANPGGRPAKVRACLQAVENERDPQKVVKALDEFYRRHMEEGDNDAGKVWLAYQIGAPDKAEPDLSDAPDAVVRWYAERN